MVKSMLENLLKVTGKEVNPIGYRQGSDGRLFAKSDIPIIIFGPSDPSVGHSTNERVSIKQLVEATKVYALTAVQMLSN